MAKQREHTAGPWSYRVIGTTVDEDENVREIAEVSALGGELVADSLYAEDARLTAAAPNLLLAARVVVDTIQRVENRCMAADGPVTPTCNEITDAELRVMFEAALAAVEKAAP